MNIAFYIDEMNFRGVANSTYQYSHFNELILKNKSIIFYNKKNKLAIVGDVLFNGSIGRTDLPGGNHDQLINSVKEKLWPLGKDIEFIPGHGPMSTFKAERISNPFVSDQALGIK